MIVLQLLLFGGIGYFVYYQVRGQHGGGDVGREAESSTTFADVAGTQGAAEDLREIVDFLKSPAAFSAVGARVPKGVLLVGPPGTGKTLLARAVAGEAGVPFFHLSGSEVTGFIVGLGAQRVRSLFKKARSKGGVIFIDELDALGGARGRNRATTRTTARSTSCWSRWTASRRRRASSSSARRTGRRTSTPRSSGPAASTASSPWACPTVDGREAILRLHAERRHIPVGGDVDFNRLARLTPGASGAELANLLNEAAIFAVRTQSDIVAWRHFEAARDRMLLGKERVGFRAPDREWRSSPGTRRDTPWPASSRARRTACTRSPSSRAAAPWASPTSRPTATGNLHPKSYLEAQIIKALGGRVAEELVFGAEHVTGGAESDLVHVNRIARRMIYRLGMAAAARSSSTTTRPARSAPTRRRAWTPRCRPCSSASTTHPRHPHLAPRRSRRPGRGAAGARDARRRTPGAPAPPGAGLPVQSWRATRH
jgi:cell division protease FtsH